MFRKKCRGHPRNRSVSLRTLLFDKLSPPSSVDRDITQVQFRGKHLPAGHKIIAFACLLFAAFLLSSVAMQGQENYEIQVYGSDTVERGMTMVEIHSNFTIDGSMAAPGSDYTANGTVPTNHAMHETLEITRGITPWFETGFYVFSSIQPNLGWQWVGDHIRPRVRAPDSWHWPVGASLRWKSGTSRRRIRRIPGRWSCGRLSISGWGGGIGLSIQHSTGRCMGRE